MLIPVKPCSFNQVSRLLMLCACVLPLCTRFLVLVLMLVNKLVVSFVVPRLEDGEPASGESGLFLLMAVFDGTVVLMIGGVLLVCVRFLRAACCASRVCVAF